MKAEIKIIAELEGIETFLDGEINKTVTPILYNTLLFLAIEKHVRKKLALSENDKVDVSLRF